MAGPAPLPRSFYQRPTVEVARSLLGAIIRTTTPDGITEGRIVETEAYLGPSDPASHAVRGPTPRARIMYGEVGIAYVYLCYGVHFCLNAVARGPESPAGAVLIRAIEPLSGIETMNSRRGRNRPTDLGSGPGKLTQAMGVNLEYNGTDLTGYSSYSSDLVITAGSAPENVVQATRIGIREAVDRPYRFYEKSNPHVSRV